MKNTKTLCFFQENAAEAEINFWYESVKNTISKIYELPEYKGKKFKVYEIDKAVKKNEIELLICIPTSIPIDYSLYAFIQRVEAEYKKTIYFGKIDFKIATMLSSIIHEFENPQS